MASFREANCVLAMIIITFIMDCNTEAGLELHVVRTECKDFVILQVQFLDIIYSMTLGRPWTILHVSPPIGVIAWVWNLSHLC